MVQLSPMKNRIDIVIDASVLIALGFENVAKLVVTYNESAIFYVTRKSLSETKKYYEKNRVLGERLKKLLTYFCDLVTVIHDSQLEPFAKEAQARIGQRDCNDWQEVALALKLGCAILTEDCDFLGAGVPTWTRATINHGLGRGQRT